MCVLQSVENGRPPLLSDALLFSSPHQMFTSRTSVGVAEKSGFSRMLLGSVGTECCCRCACRRLVSSRDSICSWHALRQSCRGRGTHRLGQ